MRWILGDLEKDRFEVFFPGDQEKTISVFVFWCPRTGTTKNPQRALWLLGVRETSSGEPLPFWLEQELGRRFEEIFEGWRKCFEDDG